MAALNKLHTQVWGRQKTDLVFNTFIGGVGASYITSAASYAAKTTLSESEIQNFQIDENNNISMYIEVGYNTNANQFNNNSITYFIDLEGKINNVGQGFVNTTNLKYFFAPNATGQIGIGNLFDNSSKLTHFHTVFNGFVNRLLLRNAKVRTLYLPHLNTIGNPVQEYPTLKDLTLLERLYIKNITSANTTFNNCGIVPDENRHDLSNVNIGCKIYIGDYLKVKDRSAINQIYVPAGSIAIGDKYYINGLTYTCVSGSPSTDGEFQWSSIGGTTGTNLGGAINADTRTGTFSKVLSIKINNTLGLYIQTIGVEGNTVTASKDVGNLGSAIVLNPNFYGGHDVHPVMIWARDNKGCTIIECGSVISVDAPTSLSYSNLTSNSVDLNFTPPTPNANGTDAYEVWVDDGTIWRKLFEHSEITSSGDTVDLSDVIADVGSLTGVKIKIRTIDGQMNFSPFSNEITL